MDTLLIEKYYIHHELLLHLLVWLYNTYEFVDVLYSSFYVLHTYINLMH